jgi:hypothetical protein
MANNICHANLAKFINFAALVGPSSLFCYTDWYTINEFNNKLLNYIIVYNFATVLRLG